MAKKGLGRGFDSLIPTDLFDESFDPTAQQDEKISELRSLKIKNIAPDPDQPRRHFDEVALNELSSSIAEHGVLQPLVVTPVNGGATYQIVAGERRYRAALMAGLEKIPALIRTLSAQHKLEISLIENIQRRDLNPIETATAYMKLKNQFNLTLDQIGERVGGKSVSAISNTLRLLRLPDSVKEAMIDGKLTEGQARPLIGADPKIIDKILNQVISEDWSARRIERYVSILRQESKPTSKDANKKDARHEKYTNDLQRRLSASVHIRSNEKGAGKIEISFKDSKDLERIQKLIEG